MHEYQEAGSYNVCLVVQDSLLGCLANTCQTILVGPTSTRWPRNSIHALQISPNPVSREEGSFRISGLPQVLSSNPRLTLYSLDGRKVNLTSIQFDEDGLTVQFPILPTGIYSVVAETSDSIYHGRVVVY